MTEGHDSRNPGLASWILNWYWASSSRMCLSHLVSLLAQFHCSQRDPRYAVWRRDGKAYSFPANLLFSFIDLPGKQRLKRGGHLTPSELQHPLNYFLVTSAVNTYVCFKNICLVSVSEFSRSSEEPYITALLTESVQFSYYSLSLQLILCVYK